MEAIINFFEQYWGITLFGSVTFGTLVTFIVVQIKDLISSKFKGTLVDTAVGKVDALCEELNKREAENQALRGEIVDQQHKLEEQQKYFDQIQTVTFQAISYLVVASKLPTEDKLALQEKFTTLVKTKTSEYTELIKDEVQSIQTKVTDTIVPDAVETVEQTVNETKSLLDKYMSEE